MIRCNGLTEFIDRHRSEYLFAFIPYMFSTTYLGALACPGGYVLVPCLHNEAYAHLDLYKPVFQHARGVIYNARAERDLARSLFPVQPAAEAILGAGVQTGFAVNADRFRQRHHLDRFLLYAGRKDQGKNVPLLIDYFCRYKELYPNDLKLALIGDGSVDVPEGHESDVVDLGFLPAQDKFDAYGAALALCQPSLKESFSLVMMEAWLARAPVLVHEHCAVTRDHCQASSGGLYFSSFDDFAGCLEWFSENAATARRMAEAGRRYVLANYTWDRTAQKYQAALRGWGFDG
jgi:glycosyltransferase involved in cell wall biosynthesis